jgi:hypothetical protein
VRQGDSTLGAARAACPVHHGFVTDGGALSESPPSERRAAWLGRGASTKPGQIRLTGRNGHRLKAKDAKGLRLLRVENNGAAIVETAGGQRGVLLQREWDWAEQEGLSGLG